MFLFDIRKISKYKTINEITIVIYNIIISLFTRKIYISIIYHMPYTFWQWLLDIQIELFVNNYKHFFFRNLIKDDV